MRKCEQASKGDISQTSGYVAKLPVARRVHAEAAFLTQTSGTLDYLALEGHSSQPDSSYCQAPQLRKDAMDEMSLNWP